MQVENFSVGSVINNIKRNRGSYLVEYFEEVNEIMATQSYIFVHIIKLKILEMRKLYLLGYTCALRPIANVLKEAKQKRRRQCMQRGRDWRLV